MDRLNRAILTGAILLGIWALMMITLSNSMEKAVTKLDTLHSRICSTYPMELLTPEEREECKRDDR
jgi:hypothetical protein